MTRKSGSLSNYIFISFHIEYDMIVVTVFLSILNQIEFHLVQNRKENCYHDHIPFNMKGNGNIVYSVHKMALQNGDKLLARLAAGQERIYKT